MTAIPRIRTINEAYAMILKQDPETRISRHALRKMVVEGKIPSYKVGNRFLLNVDALFLSLEKELNLSRVNERTEN